MHRIAFIMPTFNRARYLVEALDAVTSQMGSDDTLLIVDDGSTDETAAVVEAYRPRVDYVWQANRGKSAALNHAMALTDSDYVWICDDDDVTSAGAVALLINALAKSGAGFAFGRHTRFQIVDGNRENLGTGYWPDLDRGSILRHLLEDSFVMQNATLVRRSALRKIGPFDEALPRSIDYDMFVRLALAVPAQYVDAVVFEQRKHDGVRGPESGLHAASASMNVWAQWDRRVFDKVAETVPLATFEDLFDGDDATILSRAALLQRACVWFRHHRWEAAVPDLEAAVRIAPGIALHAVERDICSRMLNGKHGFGALLGKGPVAVRFRHLLGGSPTGRAVGWAMARGILWMLRHHEPAERKQAGAVIGQIARGTRGRGIATAWLQTGQTQTRLVERAAPRGFPLHASEGLGV